ncbi:MAG: Zn-dependent hydrolase [Negativicutes bacterium]
MSNIENVQKMISELGKIGRTKTGGITRLSYSPEYKAGMDLVSGYMTAAGMIVQIDPIGNIVGTYPGTEPHLPAVMTGSHLDTVPEGGELDGALGLLSAIECVRSWKETGWIGRRSVQVIATIEEEGTRFGIGCMGSRVMAGEFAAKSAEDFKDASGCTLSQYLRQIGLDPSNALQRVICDPSKIACFVELHIEQGEELDLAQKACALVTDIIWIDRHWVAINGHANHAGATRMDRRQDALVAAAALITEINRQALASKGQYVATMGTLEVTPGATNVIPGKVVLSIETRGAKPETMEESRKGILRAIAGIDKEFGVQVEILKHIYAPPVSLEGSVLQELRVSAREMGVQFIEMPSWAGHDAKIMAPFVPTGMIFVPSIAGISHSSVEATNWLHATEGLKILNQALKKLAMR